MNKFVNILLLLILFPIIAFSVFIGFDLPIEMLKISGASFPYKTESFYIFASLLFFILVNRSIKRWMGIKMVNQVKRFDWNVSIDRSRVKQVVLYLILEAGVHFSIAFALYQVSSYTLPVVAVLVFFGIDHLMLALLGKYRKLFRIGLTSKAILLADREVKAVYFGGLREVSSQQKSLFFEYADQLQLSLPSDAIPENEKSHFKTIFEKKLNRDKVFFSESFKEF